MAKIQELLAAQRELTTKMANATAEEMVALEREYNSNKREIELLNQQAVANANAPQREAFSLRAQLRSLLHAKDNQVNLRTALTHSGLEGKAVDVELQSILEPLYANSALAQLGVKWYKGMPMGDISIPVMGKGSVTWAGETGNNSDGTPTFGTNITLKPFRLTGFFEISEAMLLADTIGVEEALRREAVNALADKFEATVLGNGSGLAEDGTTRISPAGLFYNQNLADATSFAKVCDIESGVEAANINLGNCKYLLSAKAKATFRNMAKSAKSTQLVMEAGEIDGTPVVTSTNCVNSTKGVYAYGDFQNLACASWSDLIFKVDDSISYANGKIRIYVSGYFDAAVLRSGAFAFGDNRYVAAQ